jgi:hypothetical protein
MHETLWLNENPEEGGTFAIPLYITAGRKEVLQAST